MQSYFVTIAPFFALLFDLVTLDCCDQPRTDENHRRRNKCNIIIWRELTCTSSDTEFQIGRLMHEYSLGDSTIRLHPPRNEKAIEN